LLCRAVTGGCSSAAGSHQGEPLLIQVLLLLPEAPCPVISLEDVLRSDPSESLHPEIC
ncbi:hypothetical protein AMECASPLE_017139, partial [Ameca splendens]